MQIGIIGAGFIAQAVASHALRLGHDVIVSNSRGPATLGDVVDKLNAKPESKGTASAATTAEAIQSPVNLLAVPWTAVKAALTGLGDWDNRILIDATNQYLKIPPHPIIDDLNGLVNSEVVSQLAPGARVVKAFNSMEGQYVAASPVHAEGRQVVFFAGDDTDAKRTFVELVESFGFAPVDMGTLHDGGSIIQLGGPLVRVHVIKVD